jgi:hypothetical protein
MIESGPQRVIGKGADLEFGKLRKGYGAAAFPHAGSAALPMLPRRSRCDHARAERRRMIGMSEQELRERLESELIVAMRAEGGVPTIHAIAHSVARILEEDHLRIAEQLASAGITIEQNP